MIWNAITLISLRCYSIFQNQGTPFLSCLANETWHLVLSCLVLPCLVWPKQTTPCMLVTVTLVVIGLQNVLDEYYICAMRNGYPYIFRGNMVCWKSPKTHTNQDQARQKKARRHPDKTGSHRFEEEKNDPVSAYIANGRVQALLTTVGISWQINLCCISQGNQLPSITSKTRMISFISCGEGMGYATHTQNNTHGLPFWVLCYGLVQVDQFMIRWSHFALTTSATILLLLSQWSNWEECR